jgi:tRNA (cytidine(34)-2'-O)-methyltransferase
VFHVALFEPEIAGNTGNIARTCVAAGARLHLIRPFGFRLDEPALRRAGMDYWQELDLTLHPSYPSFAEAFHVAYRHERVFAFTTKADRHYTQVRFREGDVLLFGPESRGLPSEVRRDVCSVRLPMVAKARSLNLAASVAVGLYEAWRQIGFSGGE